MSLQPRWFTPGRLLAIFCCTNVMVYLDRGLIASNGVNGAPASETNPEGSGIQGAFRLTYFQDGLLPAAFMVGLLISSAIFAESSKHVSAFKLLGIGMGIWTLAVLACGAAPNFPLLLLARALVGVGEASFVALAAPFIDDYAPAHAKTRWFGYFFLCIPVGFAFGYIVGGVVTASLSWRWAFVMEGAVMVPFVIFCFTAQPLHLRGSGARAKGTASMHNGSLWQQVKAVMAGFGVDVWQVLRQRVWVVTCAAYTLYVAVLGVYSYWGPQAGKALFFPPDDTSNSADLVFGGVTVLTGVLGSLAGGIMLDKVGATLRNAGRVCCISNLIGCVFMLAAFNATHSFATFMAVFAVGEFFIFLLQAPVAAIGMWCVPSDLRPLGASLMTVSIHLLGDVPSPPLLGWLQSKLADGLPPDEAVQQWRKSMSIITALLVASGLIFAYCSFVATATQDFREGIEGGAAEGWKAAAVATAGPVDAAPLLGNGIRSDSAGSCSDVGAGHESPVHHHGMDAKLSHSSQIRSAEV